MLLQPEQQKLIRVSAQTDPQLLLDAVEKFKADFMDLDGYFGQKLFGAVLADGVKSPMLARQNARMVVIEYMRAVSSLVPALYPLLDGYLKSAPSSDPVNNEIMQVWRDFPSSMAGADYDTAKAQFSVMLSVRKAALAQEYYLDPKVRDEALIEMGQIDLVFDAIAGSPDENELGGLKTQADQLLGQIDPQSYTTIDLQSEGIAR